MGSVGAAGALGQGGEMEGTPWHWGQDRGQGWGLVM